MAQVGYQLLHDTPSQVFYFLLFSLLLLLLLPLAVTKRPSKQLNQPPSPPKLPIIGHLHLVGTLPHVSLRELAKKHGPDLLLLRLGAVPNLIVSSPRAAQAILRTHDHVFASRPHSRVADIILNESTDIAFSPYGEHWRQIRKLVTMHLLTVKKIQSYRLAREEEVRLVIAKIGKAAAANAAVDISELMNSFANDIVCHAVSGKFFRQEGRNKLFRELIDTNSEIFGGFNIEDYFPRLAKIDLLTCFICGKAKKAKKRWDELLDKLIDEHARKLLHHHKVDGSNGEQEESDFIDVCLSLQDEFGLTREHVKAILMDIFGAGTDTSALVLEFAMAELMRKPQLMAKLQAEVRQNTPNGQQMVTEDDLRSMTYMKAVIKETLRLHPPAPLLIPHLSISDCIIDGYTVPSGTRVFVNTWALGRDHGSWEMAEEFMPERFVDGGSAAAVDFKGNDFQFLPFGAGRRICPGLNFGMATVEILLANLVYCFEWELPTTTMGKDGIDMTEVFGLTVHRKEKLLLTPNSHSIVHKPKC